MPKRIVAISDVIYSHLKCSVTFKSIMRTVVIYKVLIVEVKKHIEKILGKFPIEISFSIGIYLWHLEGVNVLSVKGTIFIACSTILRYSLCPSKNNYGT